MFPTTRLYAGLACCVFLSGCVNRVGPSTIPPARFNYNQSIAQSQDEQLLLNLVRLRYRDTPVFLDVGNVIASYSLRGNAGASVGVNAGGANTTTNSGASVGGEFTTSPTITYEPLRGRDFTQRLLTPLSPMNLVILSQSGWSIERLLLCCVERINDITNAPSASGPTPSTAPDNSQFRELARLLRGLQQAGRMDFEVNADGTAAQIRMLPDPAAGGEQNDAALNRVRELLGLSEQTGAFRLSSRRFTREPDEILIAGRSLLGALFFLSHTVDAPPEHRESGLVTVTTGPNGAAFDWSTLTGGLIHISSSREEPPAAFTRVRYRDHWFFIDDADLESKATFNVMSYLFALQAAGEGGASPLLTLGVGN